MDAILAGASGKSGLGHEVSLDDNSINTAGLSSAIILVDVVAPETYISFKWHILGLLKHLWSPHSAHPARSTLPSKLKRSMKAIDNSANLELFVNTEFSLQSPTTG